MRRFILFSLLVLISLSSQAVVDDPGDRGVDWKQVREKIDNQAWAKAIFEDMQADVRRTKSQFEHPPLGKTGWLHEYYCDKDAQRLRFDPNKPHEHVCIKCGTVYTGSPYDDCWRSQVHSRFASAAADAAVLYRITEDKKYLNFAKETLLWYAENFDQFSPHGKHAGKGIVREQSLDEATQLVRLALAYWDICPFLTANERQTIANDFMLPDARFIHKQTGTIHNIHCWHNAAVGLVGFALGEEDLVKAAIDGPHGLIKQIQEGVNKDGFWFEGSIGYHFYTVSALQNLYVPAQARKYDLPGTEKFQLMYAAPIDFTFPNSQLPANNDCWYEQYLNERVAYYEVAAHLFADPVFDLALANFYASQKRRSSNALLYGPASLPEPMPIEKGSVLFEHTGIGILRNENLNLLMKYGPYGGGHDHRDRLNMMLFAKGELIIPDLGTSGYGIGLNKWYRSPAAHNMVVVDGNYQARKGGYLSSFDDSKIAAGADRVYEGVDLQREIALRASGFWDRVSAESDEKHQYDLIYHMRGTLKKNNLAFSAFDGLAKKNGYGFIKNAQMANCSGETQLTWDLRDADGALRLQVNADSPFQVIVGECPDNPGDEVMSIVILRKKAKAMEWENVVVLD